MRCPFCGHEESKVVDSRVSEGQDAIRRRRECLSCTQRFTTYERMEEQPLMVVKRDGSREPWDRNKLMRGLMTAATKRDLTAVQLDALVADVEAEIRNSLGYEVSARQVGDMVLKRLKALDGVAYIRFASVYKSFKDLDEFTAELRELR
jgi:transcriptional repressor NrdR